MEVAPETMLAKDDFLISTERDKAFSKTLVLDMDETLVHSVRVPSNYSVNPRQDGGMFAERRGSTIFLEWPDGFLLRVYLRPGLDEFLRFCAANFEVVLWTAGIKSYADEVVKKIDTRGRLFKHVITRDSKWFHNASDGQGYVKDLSKLGRSLDSTVLVDNSPFVCRYNFENSIIVSDWNKGTLRKRDGMCNFFLFLRSPLTHSST